MFNSGMLHHVSLQKADPFPIASPSRCDRHPLEGSEIRYGRELPCSREYTS
jgi:hypothetical protein